MYTYYEYFVFKMTNAYYTYYEYFFFKDHPIRFNHHLNGFTSHNSVIAANFTVGLRTRYECKCWLVCFECKTQYVHCIFGISV